MTTNNNTQTKTMNKYHYVRVGDMLVLADRFGILQEGTEIILDTERTRKIQKLLGSTLKQPTSMQNLVVEKINE